MLLKIINYGIRILIVVIGILFLSGYFDLKGYDSTTMRVMGVVFILFGLYRITIYYSQSKRYERWKKDDD